MARGLSKMYTNRHQETHNATKDDVGTRKEPQKKTKRKFVEIRGEKVSDFWGAKSTDLHNELQILRLHRVSHYRNSINKREKRNGKQTAEIS